MFCDCVTREALLLLLVLSSSLQAIKSDMHKAEIVIKNDFLIRDISDTLDTKHSATMLIIGYEL